MVHAAPHTASAAHSSVFFFFNATATTEIYTLSLHDALPICRSRRKTNKRKSKHSAMLRNKETRHRMFIGLSMARSEERFSRNAETDLVCRLLLEKKKENKGNIYNPIYHRVLYTPPRIYALAR